MTIVSQPVYAIEQRLFCDEPGCDEEMVATGESFPVNPRQYEYQCENLHRCRSQHQYPRIVHLPLPKVED